MKRLILLLVALIGASDLLAQVNIYGSSGANFTPSAWINREQPLGGSLDAQMDHFSLLYTVNEWDLEFGLSSSPGWVNQEGFKQTTIVAPIIPSAKLNLFEDQNGILNWGYSVGVNFPYGLYYAAGLRVKTPILQPEVNLGSGIPNFGSIYVFGSTTLMFANLQGNTLPFGLIGEGAYAANTELIGEVRETFWSIGTVLKLGDNFNFQALYRKDPITYKKPSELDEDILIELPDQNKSGEFRLRFTFNFKGIKNAAEVHNKEGAQ